MIERVRPTSRPPAPAPKPERERDNTVVHKTVPCQFCKKRYLKPCDEKRKTTCQNFIHLTAPKSAPRVKPKAKSKKRK